jgi:hypothetical protein
MYLCESCGCHLIDGEEEYCSECLSERGEGEWEKIKIEKLMSDGELLWIAVKDLNQDLEIVTARSKQLSMEQARREGMERALGAVEKRSKEPFTQYGQCSDLHFGDAITAIREKINDLITEIRESKEE